MFGTVAAFALSLPPKPPKPPKPKPPKKT